jgi:hypothetical protein
LLPQHQDSSRKIIYINKETVRQGNQILEHEKSLHQDNVKEFEQSSGIKKAEFWGKNQRSRLFPQLLEYGPEMKQLPMKWNQFIIKRKEGGILESKLKQCLSFSSIILELLWLVCSTWRNHEAEVLQ